MTGAGIVVGASGLTTTGGEGLAASPSKVLYFAGFGPAGSLRTVDRTTGATTSVATLTGAPAGDNISALAFSPTGTLYGVTLVSGGGAAHLVTINTSTGAATDVGSTVAKLDAIAFSGVSAQGLAVDPAASALSDGNGIFEPGETAAVQPSWRNGMLTSVSFTCTASGLTGPAGAVYLITDTAAVYPTIAAGAAGSCATTPDCYAMSITAPGTRPATHWDATFTETVTTTTSPKVWMLDLGDSFTDVPRSELFYKKIEAIFHHGITVGCTGTTYCPSDKVPRSQMAIFIARGISHAAVLPTSGTTSAGPYNCVSGGTSVFTDVSPTDIFCKGVHYIAAQNVTAGDVLFLSRTQRHAAEMAIFVAKGIVAPGGETAVPLTYGPDPTTGFSYSCNPAAPNLHFTDVSVGDSFCKQAHFLWAKESSRVARRLSTVRSRKSDATRWPSSSPTPFNSSSTGRKRRSIGSRGEVGESSRD